MKATYYWKIFVLMSHFAYHISILVCKIKLLKTMDPKRPKNLTEIFSSENFHYNKQHISYYGQTTLPISLRAWKQLTNPYQNLITIRKTINLSLEFTIEPFSEEHFPLILKQKIDNKHSFKLFLTNEISNCLFVLFLFCFFTGRL